MLIDILTQDVCLAYGSWADEMEEFPNTRKYPLPSIELK